MQTWERYSNRLEGKHPLSGLVGRALLSDIPEPLWPYLILGQWVHVGKSASFGQGRYIVLPQADPAQKGDPVMADIVRCVVSTVGTSLLTNPATPAERKPLWNWPTHPTRTFSPTIRP